MTLTTYAHVIDELPATNAEPRTPRSGKRG
jgi:hypothetical protein